MDPGLGGGSDAISKDISVSNSTFSICGALYARFFCACPLISVVFIAWIPLFLKVPGNIIGHSEIKSVKLSSKEIISCKIFKNGCLQKNYFYWMLSH